MGGVLDPALKTVGGGNKEAGLYFVLTLGYSGALPNYEDDFAGLFPTLRTQLEA